MTYRQGRVQAILEDLTESRQAQQAAKVAQQAHMAVHEKADFERILRANREKEEQDAQLAAQARFICTCAPSFVGRRIAVLLHCQIRWHGALLFAASPLVRRLRYARHV